MVEADGMALTLTLAALVVVAGIDVLVVLEGEIVAGRLVGTCEAVKGVVAGGLVVDESGVTAAPFEQPGSKRTTMANTRQITIKGFLLLSTFLLSLL
jgi:hypothetical protein